MNIFQAIQQQVHQAFPALFGSEVELNKITINETPKEFIGDITLVVFPLLKITKKNPEESAKTIGEFLVNNNKNITAYHSDNNQSMINQPRIIFHLFIFLNL